jgi:hypothetical protein
MRFPGLEWFQPTKAEVNWYLAATTVFLLTLFAAYYFDPLSRKIAARTFNNWPPISNGVLLLTFAICCAFMVLSQIGPLMRTTFFGPFLLKVAFKSFVFATLFSFFLWYRQKVNILWLAVFIGVLLLTCLLAMVFSPGRRYLLSIATGPVLVVYFTHARYWRPSKGLAVVAVATIALFLVSLMYSSIRHFGRDDPSERTARTMVRQMKKLGEKNWFGRFANDQLFAFSQQVVHYALLTDRFVSEGRLKPRPLNSLAVMISYPIPRKIWDDKPQVLGVDIVRDALDAHVETNWGCGISGHAAYEGGLIVPALYAYLLVFLIRMFDDPLQRQPTNPFLIGMLASAGVHLVSWPRGDLAIMTLNCVECFFFAWALGLVARILFGTQRIPQVTRRSATLPYPTTSQKGSQLSASARRLQ